MRSIHTKLKYRTNLCAKHDVVTGDVIMLFANDNNTALSTRTSLSLEHAMYDCDTRKYMYVYTLCLKKRSTSVLTAG